MMKAAYRCQHQWCRRASCMRGTVACWPRYALSLNWRLLNAGVMLTASALRADDSQRRRKSATRTPARPFMEILTLSSSMAAAKVWREAVVRLTEKPCTCALRAGEIFRRRRRRAQRRRFKAGPLFKSDQRRRLASEKRCPMWHGP